jgi:hypothetical protein
MLLDDTRDTAHEIDGGFVKLNTAALQAEGICGNGSSVPVSAFSTK